MTPYALSLISNYKGAGRAIGVEAAQAVVKEYIHNRNLHQNQIDALVCFIDNVGMAAFLASGVSEHINKGNLSDLKKAVVEMSRWVKWEDKVSRTMTARRKKECALFNTPALVVHNTRKRSTQ